MSEQVYVYPTTEQCGRWERRAEEMGMSLSDYVASMTEAGAKKFDRSFEPLQSNDDLRRQRDDLKSQLDDARTRINRLERQLFRGQRGTIKQFVEDNPGADYGDILRHVEKNAPERLRRLLDEMEGDALAKDDGGYYPADGSGGDHGA